MARRQAEILEKVFQGSDCRIHWIASWTPVFYKMNKSILLGLSGALFTLLFALLFDDLVSSWELKTLDMRFRIRGEIPTDPALIMIDADDPSAAKYGPWPWDRSVHAKLLESLKDSGVAVVAFDILFGQQKEPESDAALVQSARKLGNVVQPVAVSLSETKIHHDLDPSFTTKLWESISTPPKAEALYYTEDVIPPFSELMEKNHLGHIATNRDVDGIVRRVPLIVRHDDKLLPSLAFQTVLNFLHVSPENIEFTDSSMLIHKARFPYLSVPQEITIPVDSKGQMLINFAGKWATTFKHASYQDLLSAKPETVSEKNETLENKIIFVANTLSGSDMKSIPLEKNYPGPGIHANIINTILTKNFLKETSPLFNIVIIVLISLAVSRVLSVTSRTPKILLLILLTAGYVAGGILLFFLGVVVQLFLPLFAIGLSSVLVLMDQVKSEKSISKILKGEKQELETINTIIENERDAIAEIQRSLLGHDHPQVSGFKFFSDYRPSSKAGGDYYDFIAIDKDHLGVLIADVSGHGTPTAIIMAMMRALMRSFAHENPSPEETFKKLNKTLLQNFKSGYFITAFYGVVHLPTNIMKFTSAGHPPPILINYSTGQEQELSLDKGIPLMILPDCELEEGEIRLQPNSKLMLFTDGVFEVRNPAGEIFGISRLTGLLCEFGENHGAVALGNRIREKIQEFAGKPTFEDDYTLVLVDIANSGK
jgi:serine phosphatase RsbU (regulator of sigma subunit)/CHASE2 domain-containing sensor protein